MLRQVILFGAGHDGRKALEFFGGENVFCFVDNSKDLTGTLIKGKKILSLEQLKALYAENHLTADIMFEVVISMSFNRWAVHAVAMSLKKIGIEDFSIFSDIERRWSVAEDFLRRDRDIYPCEQESLLAIYKVQLDYMIRHTNPENLLPATGKLREVQLAYLEGCVSFMEKIKHLDVKPFLIAGSLLGAVRHKGFTPWDDDIDFGVTRKEYNIIYEYLLSNCGVYKSNFDTDWQQIEWVKENPEQFPNDYDSEYIVLNAWGHLNIRRLDEPGYNMLDLRVSKLPPGCFDIFAVDFFPDTFTDDDYLEMIGQWIDKEKKFGITAMNEMWLNEIEDKNKYPEKSKRVGHPMSWIMNNHLKLKYLAKEPLPRIWDFDSYFPLKKATFENVQFWAPCDTDAVLSKFYGKDYMQMPPRVGVPVHNKEAIFTEEY
ncbi:MAG: LicD family protein [Oscillospiraceae bacterium]|nr:LicD family protein [Oscillospiraceae bacterium]